ncbi:MAG: hypothetical protein U9Q30_08145 [Campylobacterota bacterium]|nr:hypothetical protein [Campylobacterota bacterium]
MNNNETVEQLKKALNQLLGAYESLKADAEQLQVDKDNLNNEIDNLEYKNEELTLQLDSLTDTTTHQSSEMGEMLGRIESILGSVDEVVGNGNSSDSLDMENNIVDDNSSGSNNPSSIEELVAQSSEIETSIDKKDEKIETIDENFKNNKDIDMGRMQSLLNGFNNS